MTIRKQFTLVFIAVSAMLFSACQKDADQLTWREQRLVGTWKVTKERFRSSIWVDNAQQRLFLMNAELVLGSNRSASLLEENGETTQVGTWELEDVTTFDDDGTNCVQMLVLALHDPDTKDTRSIVLENVSITKRVIRSCTDEREGTYRHKFEKI